jgi:DNA invertase Pin-like site-specific DNA recombinase
VSGTAELADRDGLARLFDRIDSNGVRLVLVERADRLARDLLVGEVILSQFRERGVKVIEASGNELTADDGDPTKVLIRQLLGAVAQFDKSVVVRKLRAARDRHRAKYGRCEGRKPYGDLPGEDLVLNQILTMRRKPRNGRRMSYQRIADGLNTAGILARYGNEWRGATIRNIVVRERG